MNTTKICPGCKKPLPANAPDGLCPECLMKAGLPTGFDMGQDTETDTKRPPVNAPSLEEIARLFPHLEILGLLGQGGMGAVYRARQKELDRVVALKILPPDIGRDPAFAERFAREARAMAKLNHPGIITLYEFGRADGLFFFLMEFVDGVNLRQLQQAGRISPREALMIVPQICDALQYAHDHGIVHRDIKPENILVDRQGRVKVADFGIAKLVSQGDAARSGESNAPGTSLTEAGKVVGTPQYMAPEQREHPTAVDHRADIYSLGVVFYQMLTGELPGKPIEAPSHRVHVDVRLDEVVLHALEKEPERRYQRASQVKTDLESIAQHPLNEGPALAQNEKSAWRRHLHVKAGCFFFAAVCFLFAALSFFRSDTTVLSGVLSLVAVYGFTIAGYRYFQAALSVSLLPDADSASPNAEQTANTEKLRQEISGPAVGLVLTGLLNWLLVPLAAVAIRRIIAFEWKDLDLQLSHSARNAIINGACAFSLTMASYMIYAGMRMLRLENFRSAVVASIAAIAVPGNLIGIPIGIWSLFKLTRSHIRAAFKPAKDETWFMPKWGLFLAVGLLGAYATQAMVRFLQREGTTPYFGAALLFGFIAALGVLSIVWFRATQPPHDTRSRQPSHPEIKPNGWESALIVLGLVIFITVLVVAPTVSPGLREMLTFLCVIGLCIWVLTMAGWWPAPGFFIPDSGFARRNLHQVRALGYAGFVFACFAGVIPTIFYWLAPWLVPWLTPAGQDLMLWLTLASAFLAVMAGLGSRKSGMGRTALIVGSINLGVWMLFFLTGMISGTEVKPRVAQQTPSRHFIRIVAGEESLSFQGKPVTWEDLGKVLSQVPDRKHTVLQLGVTSDQLPAAQQNEWMGKANELAKRYDFEYVSYVGVQPGSAPAILATANARSYALRLTNGAGFQVLAVCSSPRSSTSWWRPDGALLVEPPGDKIGTLSQLCPPHKSAVEFAVQANITNHPVPADVFAVAFEPKPQYTAMVPLYKGEQPIGQVALVGYQSAPQQLTCKLAFLKGDWQPVATFDGAGTLLENRSTGHIRLIRSSADGEACMKLEHEIDPARFAVRIAVRLRNGESRFARVCEVAYGGGQSALLCSLLKGLPDDEVLAYEIYRAPVQWAVVPDIAIKPSMPPLNASSPRP